MLLIKETKTKTVNIEVNSLLLILTDRNINLNCLNMLINLSLLN
jgi:hypothetical protein